MARKGKKGGHRAVDADLADSLSGSTEGVLGTAKVAGCRCHACPLRTEALGGPIRDSGPTNAPFVVLGEAPGQQEILDGIPFVGRSGQYLKFLLKRGWLDRDKVRIGNVILCRPPGRSFDDYLEGIKRRNANIKRKNVRARREAKELAKVEHRKFYPEDVPQRPLLNDPRVCCRGRLLRFIAGARTIVVMGAKSLEAVTGERGIAKYRGSPMKVCLPDGEEVWELARKGLAPWEAAIPGGSELPTPTLVRPDPLIPLGDTAETRVKGETWVLATVHPAYVLREGPGRAYARLLRLDFDKALRLHSQDKTTWTEPGFEPDPTAARAIEWIAWVRETKPKLAVDVETDSKDPMTAGLRCIGMSVGEGGSLNIPWKRLDATEPYGVEERKAVREAVAGLMLDPDVVKLMHNGQYDVQVLERHGFEVRAFRIDTLIGHHAAHAQLPHNLNSVGTEYTDVRYYKQDVKDGADFHADTDLQLWTYCLRDCLLTHRIHEPILLDVKQRSQERIFEQGMGMQEVCRKMRGWGVPADLEAAAQVGVELKLEEMRAGNLMRELLETTDYRQMMLELAERQEEEISKQSAAGVRKQAMLFNPNGQYGLQTAVKALQLPLETETMTGLICTDKSELTLCSFHADESGRRFIKALLDFRKANKLRGTFITTLPQIVRNGRMHPSWRSFGTVSGRFACRSPNCFDGETEVLTERGWVAFSDLDPDRGDRIAQWEATERRAAHGENLGTIRFVHPTLYVRKHYTGYLLHIRTRATDLMVTPDHRCMLESKVGGLRIFEARDYPNRYFRQLHAGVVEPEDPWDMSPAALRFLLATQADGHYTRGRQVDFRFEKRRKQEAIEDIFAQLGIVCEGKDDPDAAHPHRRRYRVGGEWAEWVRGVMPDKRLPWRLLQLHPRLHATFVDDVFFWDGCWTRKNHYSSSEKHNADVVQAALSLMGVKNRQRVYWNGSPRARDNYQIDRTRSRLYSGVRRRTIDYVPHDGTVYCLSVPSSYVVVRRNGCVMVTSQCQNWPKLCRKVVRLVPGGGRIFVGADYANLEFRLAAWLSGDRAMQALFKSGKDAHTMNAANIFQVDYKLVTPDIRKVAKGFIFALSYGGSAQTVWENMIQTDPTVTLEHIEGLYRQLERTYPTWIAWRKWLVEVAQERGYSEEIICGRRFYYPSRDMVEPTFAQNLPVQGAAGSTMNIATLKLMPRLSEFRDAKLILQVHDFVGLEVDEDEGDRALAMLEEELPGPYTLDHGHGNVETVFFPVDSKKGYSWDKI